MGSRQRAWRSRLPGPVAFVVDSVAMGWRWLVRMRTALILLGVLGLLTALATAVPQEPNVPGTVAAWRTGDEGPGVTFTRILDALGAFDVYGSPAFLALLLALYLSLTACLVPRIRAWVRLVRHSRPPLDPTAPTRSTASMSTSRDVTDVAEQAAELLNDRHWRVRTGQVAAGDTHGAHQIAGEKGLWSREGGSLLFHLSFYVLLAAIVFGQLMTFEGQRGVIENEPGFADTEISYWTYRPGRWFTPDMHQGWRLNLDEFHVDWIRDPLAAGAGQPTTFRSDVTVTRADGSVLATDVEGNRPLVVDGRKIHQLDWGYAPYFEVEVDGQTVHGGFLTTVLNDDGAYVGAVKAPAAQPDVGLDIELFPFAPDGDDGIPRLTGAPWDDAPLVIFHQWRGDLQLGATQQLITELDTDQMDLVGWGFLRPGQQVELEGVTIRFVELRRWVGFQVSYRPQLPWLILAGALLVGGLIPALYAYRRRVWVTVRSDADGRRTLVDITGRTFQRPEVFDQELASLTEALRQRLVGEPLDAAATPREGGPVRG